MFCISRSRNLIYEDWKQLKKENLDLRNQLMQHSCQMIAIQNELHALQLREQTLAQQNELLHVENQQALQVINNQLSQSKERKNKKQRSNHSRKHRHRSHGTNSDSIEQGSDSEYHSAIISH